MRRREADRELRRQKLLVMPTAATRDAHSPVAYGCQQPGELLSGSERRRPDWLLDVKYRTAMLKFLCSSNIKFLHER